MPANGRWDLIRLLKVKGHQIKDNELSGTSRTYGGEKRNA